MRELHGADIIRIWEAGQRQSSVERALTILAVALTERRWDDLLALPVGRRDALLFAVRAGTLGPRLESVAGCPECGEKLEFAIDSTPLATSAAEPDVASYRLQLTDGWLDYRLPNSDDLAAIVACADVGAARALLARRCVVAGELAGAEPLPSKLPDEVMSALADVMAEHDARADIAIALTCPACGHNWQSALDIGTFLWTELNARAQHLLREVAALARAYGWREADVLAMSAARRQFYLEQVGAV
jgi:hypothetical protein